MFDGWLSNLFSSSTGAVANTAGQSVLNNAGNIMSNIPNSGFLSGMYNVGNYIPDVAQQGVTDAANGGILSSMYNFGSNTMDFLKNESVGKALSAGTNAFSAYNQYNQAKDAKKMANEQMKMAKDAYAYDRANAEKTARLVF